MKSSNIATTGAVVLLAMTLPSESFEIHTEELLSHSILARLILQSPTRMSATRQKSGMAFLAEKAVEPQAAFLTERDTTSEEQSSDAEVSKEDKTKQVPLAFGLARS